MQATVQRCSWQNPVVALQGGRVPADREKVARAGERFPTTRQG